MENVPPDPATALTAPRHGDVRFPRRIETWLVAVTLLVAALLRLVLAVCNDAANDDHYRVVQLLLAGRRGLTLGDCRECFHPKLYYAVVAGLARGLGATDLFWLLRLGQLLNAGAGVLTLWLVHRFLLRGRWPAAVRLTVLALAAFNPALVAIDVQLTNDSLAILLGVAGTYGMVRFLDGRRLRYLGLGAVALALAFATKGTTWICGIVSVLVLLPAACARLGARGGRAWRAQLPAPVLVAALLVGIAVSGYDFGSYRVYANLGATARLHFFAPTHVARPGVVSVYDSYLSFQLFDLLRFPYTRNGFPIEPAHRSSVFSQLYGRLHFLHFDCWPPAWKLPGRSHYALGRWNLLLGLVPTTLFGAGLVLRLARLGRTLRQAGIRRWPNAVAGAGPLCLLLALGALAFIVYFTAHHRDFSAMKPVYLFPAMLGFVYLLADGYAFVWSRWRSWPRARVAVWAASGMLLVGYGADVLVLVAQMAVRNGAEVARYLGWG